MTYSGGLKKEALTLAYIESAGVPESPQYDAVAFFSRPTSSKGQSVTWYIIWKKRILERTSACEIARMRTMCASLYCSESAESEESDTGEMHVGCNGYENT